MRVNLQLQSIENKPCFGKAQSVDKVKSQVSGLRRTHLSSQFICFFTCSTLLSEPIACTQGPKDKIQMPLRISSSAAVTSNSPFISTLNALFPACFAEYRIARSKILDCVKRCIYPVSSKKAA